jgi:hypothetical protein
MRCTAPAARIDPTSRNASGGRQGTALRARPSAPIVNILFPQTEQIPSVAGRPFFSVIRLMSLISRWTVHFTQWPVAVVVAALINSVSIMRPKSKARATLASLQWQDECFSGLPMRDKHDAGERRTREAVPGGGGDLQMRTLSAWLPLLPGANAVFRRISRSATYSSRQFDCARERCWVGCFVRGTERAARLAPLWLSNHPLANPVSRPIGGPGLLSRSGCWSSP